MTESCAIDVILIYPEKIEIIVDQWYPKEELERIIYKDKPPLKEDTQYDPELHSAQPPLVIKDSGPAEAIDTMTLPTGHGKPSGFNVIGNTGIDQYEICPNCQEVLHLYGVKDIITRDKIYRCRNCHQELVKSTIGWVIPRDQEPTPRKHPNDIGFP